MLLDVCFIVIFVLTYVRCAHVFDCMIYFNENNPLGGKIHLYPSWSNHELLCYNIK